MRRWVRGRYKSRSSISDRRMRFDRDGNNCLGWQGKRSPGRNGSDKWLRVGRDESRRKGPIIAAVDSVDWGENAEQERTYADTLVPGGVTSCGEELEPDRIALRRTSLSSKLSLWPARFVIKDSNMARPR